MSTTTTNYGLIKPDTTDPILIGQLNDNSDAIDAALKENADAIENKPDAADIPTPSTAAPAMDGTAAAGTSTDYARADHVHPSDTSKQDALSAAQLAAANSGIDSAKVEQIETNKNNILSLQNSRGVLSDATTIIDTDWTLTTIELIAPVNSIVNMTAALVYGAKAPRGIRITRSNTSPTTGVIANIEVSDDEPQIITQAIGVKLNGINTYYVWAKAKAATTNVPAYLIYEIY